MNLGWPLRERTGRSLDVFGNIVHTHAHGEILWCASRDITSKELLLCMYVVIGNVKKQTMNKKKKSKKWRGIGHTRLMFSIVRLVDENVW